jgi:hypothetical protein
LLYLREHIAAEPLHSVMLGGRCNACEMEMQSPNKVKTAFRILILCILAERDGENYGLNGEHKVVISGSMTPCFFSTIGWKLDLAPLPLPHVPLS